MSQPIRIGIVEDDAGVRESLQQIFGGAPDFRVIGTWGNAEAALQELPAKAPNVILMDINLPGMSGIDLLRQIKPLLPSVRVVMVTVYDDNDTLFQALVAGADGYLLKRATRLRLLDSVREIVAGGAPISPQIARRMVEYFHQLKQQNQPDPAAAAAASVNLQGLTTREHEVLAKLAAGLAPKEVASELGISWDTVRNHTTSIYTKLHVHSRSEAILKYLGRKPGTER
jgi:DNA-binding NarL/FixJ family response regulator